MAETKTTKTQTVKKPQSKTQTVKKPQSKTQTVKKPAKKPQSKTQTVKKPSSKVNYTVSKKADKEWTVKKDGVDRYYRHTSKADAFADAESKITSVKGRTGRIKIHEDGKYTSNWFIEANKAAELTSGNQDAEILALIKAQKAKIDALQKQKATAKPAAPKESALKIAKEAKKEALEAKDNTSKAIADHDALRKADSETNRQVVILEGRIAELEAQKDKNKKGMIVERVVLGFILLLVIAIFVYILLIALGVVTL